MNNIRTRVGACVLAAVAAVPVAAVASTPAHAAPKEPTANTATATGPLKLLAGTKLSLPCRDYYLAFLCPPRFPRGGSGGW